MKLYRATGERAYLELARPLRRPPRPRHAAAALRLAPAYLVDRVPVREQTVVEGHCVRQLYLNCGATDVFTELGEPLDPMLAAWEDMVDGKTYITGGVGSDRAHEAFGAPFEIAPAVRVRRDVRGDRVRVLELAPAAGHGRSPLRRPARAHALQRRARGRRVRPLRVQLLEHAPRHPGPAPVVRLRVLPAEPDAAARLAAHLPRHRRRRRADDPPVRDRHGGRSARAHGVPVGGTDRDRRRSPGPPACPGLERARAAQRPAGRARVRRRRPRPQHTRSRHAPESDRRPTRACLRSAGTWRSSAARSCSAWRRANLVPYAFAERALRVWIPQKVSRQSVWAASRPSTASAPT